MIAELAKTIMFSSLSEDVLDSIKHIANPVRVKQEQTLFTQGQPFRSFYFIRSGCMKLIRITPGGDEKIIEIIQQGNYFAEALAFMNSPVYPVSAIAVTDAELISVDAKKYLDVLSGSTLACFNLLAVMSQRIHHLVREIDMLSMHTTKSRVAYYLMNCLERSGSNDFELEMSKLCVASRLSMKPETFSRALHNLEKNGVITVKRRRITVNDKNSLGKLAFEERASV
jgi:CRP-like cAMP-binding protein